MGKKKVRTGEGIMKIKGVILARGLGQVVSLTKITDKTSSAHIRHTTYRYIPFQTLVDAGIRRHIIVTGGNHAGEISGCWSSGNISASSR
jgi:dTDP-glucose pyrophosphorylase